MSGRRVQEHGAMAVQQPMDEMPGHALKLTGGKCENKQQILLINY